MNLVDHARNALENASVAPPPAQRLPVVYCPHYDALMEHI